MKLNNKGLGTIGYVLIGCGVVTVAVVLLLGIGGYSLFKMGDSILKETYAYSIEEKKIEQELRSLSSEALRIKSKEQLVDILNRQKNLKSKFESIPVSETLKPIVGACREVKVDILESVSSSADKLLVIVNSDTPNTNEIAEIVEENTKNIEEISKKGDDVCKEYEKMVKEAEVYNKNLQELGK